jgi:hypothetical protein
MGTLEDLRASSCSDHEVIIKRLAQRALQSHETYIFLMKDIAHRAIRLRFASFPSHFLVRLPTDDNQPCEGQGRILDSTCIRDGLLKEWKNSCRYIHGSNCDLITARKTALKGRPNYLVDTLRMCITRAQGNQSYVALSYVWGACGQLRTVNGNLQSLLQEDSLDKPEWASKIPQTIRDAMRVVGTLDERYLWVDALCIIQDDEIEKHSQINDMAAIYANASLTIIAAQGDDAKFGLRGVKGVTEPRDFHQEIIPLGNQCSFICSPIVPLSSSTWSKRGWTFQESLLSQRKIIFCGDRVQWQCLCAVWNEDRELDDVDTPLHSRWLQRYGLGTMFYGLFSSPWPDLHAYNKLVAEYSVKNLTYPEDIESAFSGLTEALASTFEGGFLFGIPEIFFDVGLLWKAEVGFPFKRRTATHSQPDNTFPSWSWMGWMGRIDEFSWATGLHYMKRSDLMNNDCTSQRTIPLVQWYTGDKSNPRRKVITTISTCTTFTDIGPSDLDSGWTCHPNRTRQQPRSWSCWGGGSDGKRRLISGSHNPREPDYYYTHDSDPKAQFWRPVLICRENANNPLSAPMPLISCTTQRTFFRLGEKLKYRSSISIRTNSGTWAGCLKPDQDAPESWPQISDTCELAVISEGFAYNDNHEERMDEWTWEESPRSGDKYEFYNVMWISWIDGIAYRNGLGRVPKEVWKEAEPETIDLVLG